MSVCHYMRVAVGGVGGSRLAVPTARSTAAARGVPVVTERLLVSYRLMRVFAKKYFFGRGRILIFPDHRFDLIPGGISWLRLR
jgi:hypothetical protein